MDDLQRKPESRKLGMGRSIWAILLLSILLAFQSAEALHGERVGEGFQLHKRSDSEEGIDRENSEDIARWERVHPGNEAAAEGRPLSAKHLYLPLVASRSNGLLSSNQMQATLTCDVDLGGKGLLDATCELKDSVTLSGASSIQGAGNLTLLQGVAINCSLPDCLINITLGGDLKLLKDAAIVGGQLHVEAENVVIKKGGAISAKALGGKPPPQTSGSPTTSDGSGGGHGGRVRANLLQFCQRSDRQEAFADARWSGAV